MKRCLWIIPLLLVLAILAGCDALVPTECNHLYSAWQTVQEPTCQEQGIRERICSKCSAAEQDSIEKLPHTEEVIPAVDPTCTSSGRSEGLQCKFCNAVLIPQTTIVPTHVAVVDAAVAPSCLANGLTEGFHCGICNLIIIPQAEIPMIGEHTIVQDEAVAATPYSTGLTEGSHCSVCNEVLVAQEVIPVLECPNGFITTEPTIIRTKHLEFHIDPNVYIPPNFVETVDIVTDAMETVSGMTFSGNEHYVDGTLKVMVRKTIGSEAEDGEGYASRLEAWIAPIDLVNLRVLIHECAHALQSRQSNWAYCEWARESISTYTTYKTQAYIAQHYPTLIEAVGTTNSSILNQITWDYSKLYENTMEHWMDHTFEYAFNNNYSIGFRFAWFLDVVYGDYTKWFYAYEAAFPRYEGGFEQMLSTEEQATAFQMAYGEDVFDQFYIWLKQNEDIFSTMEETDLTGSDQITVYPAFNTYKNSFELNSISYSNAFSYYPGTHYKDLYIGLDAGRYYLTEYKHKNCDELILTVDAGITLKLYDADGNLLRTVTTTRNAREVDISDVSVVHLVGEGEIHTFIITGYK